MLGRYLIRNGNTILFQMRAPKNAIHPNGCIVRISLGALSLREAREIADELASLMRTISRALGRKMSDQNHSDENDAGDDLSEIDSHFYNFVLKSALYKIRNPVRAPTEDEKKGHELLRNLLSINREVEAKKRGDAMQFLLAHIDDASLRGWVIEQIREDRINRLAIHVRPGLSDTAVIASWWAELDTDNTVNDEALNAYLQAQQTLKHNGY
ncbi:Hypothetical protein BROD_2443 [Brucella sp. NF 2653]|nr:Hypothetical protein BROD_2443 [Brucella sp. NF 2653]